MMATTTRPQPVRSVKSACSRPSGRSYPQRYRAHNSFVDETLFGASQKDQHDILEHRHLSLSEAPSGLSIILYPSQMERIKAESYVLSKKERAAVLEAKQKKKEEAMIAAEERKASIRQADLDRKRNQGLSDIEARAQQQAQYLLERANTMRMEQQDDVRKLNKVILDAQCNAVRDTQILEKKQIQKELHEEELRLHSMMEVHRRRAMEAEEKIENLRKQQHILGKAQIQKQIEERLEERLLKDEIKEQENQKMLENLKKLQTEELETLQKKKEQQRQLHLEIFKINQETMRAKERRMEAERLADQRNLEYIRQKMEREAQHEEEQRKLKREKELELARLRALQERERDRKAEQDELRARRNQEAAEREWRRKEKEKAQKHFEEVEKLKSVWMEQVSHKEHLLSIEAARNRAAFERVLRSQKEAIDRAREEVAEQRQQVAHYAEAVRQQMREREAQAIENRKHIVHDSERLKDEALNRQAQLSTITEKKLRELKEAGLPEKYWKEVEKKALTLPALVH
ncbi:cilia- and flagella-associated protein 45-like isoform X1 [Arapaima gigas]